MSKLQRKIARLKACPNIMLLKKKDDGDVEFNVSVGSRVFVTGKDKNNSDDFRIAQVQEIKVNKKGTDGYFHVQFFLTTDDLPDDNLLAPTELVPGGMDWVHAGDILGDLEDWFRIFDDSLADPPRANSQIWFYRPTKTPCSSCQKDYHPHIDRQRYCYNCSKWFHVQCTEDHTVIFPDFTVVTNPPELDTEISGEDGLPLILEEIISRPAVRGHGGRFSFDDCWLNTGSGVQKALAIKWREENDLPEDWLAQLGEKFLEEFVIDKNWKWFRCSFCSGKL